MQTIQNGGVLVRLVRPAVRLIRSGRRPCYRFSPRSAGPPTTVRAFRGLVPDQYGRLGPLRIDGDGRQARSVWRQPTSDGPVRGGVERRPVPKARVDYVSCFLEGVPDVGSAPSSG